MMYEACHLASGALAFYKARDLLIEGNEQLSIEQLLLCDLLLKALECF